MNKPNVIISYGGRFQPVHKGHKGVYDALVKKFGKKNVYVTTSNKTDPERSPLSFQWKKKLLSGVGIPSNKIVQVKNPYRGDEMFKAAGFKPEETIWIAAVGEKDGKRLHGFKYFLPYKEGVAMTTADEHGYYYVIPNIKMGGKVMSATAVRSILRKDGALDSDDYSELKASTGMNRATIDQIRPLFEHYDDGVGSLLTEGGAGGHMRHLYDDRDLTFDNLETIFKTVLSGDLKREDVTEKIDGQNLFASIIDGHIRFARNKSNLKNSGAQSMSITDMKEKWKDIPAVKDAFVESAKELEKALLQIPSAELEEIFQNGRNWINIEVVWAGNVNVIDYDGSSIVLHNLNIINDDGTNAGMEPKLEKKLFKKVQGLKVGNIKVNTPIMLSLKKVNDFSSKLAGFKSDLTKFRQKQKLGKGATIGDWLDKFWEKKIKVLEKKYNHKVTPALRKKLVKRLSEFDKSYRLPQIKKDIGFLPFYNDYREMDKGLNNSYKEAIEPLKKITFLVGIEVLKNIETYLTANPDKTVQKLRADLDREISAVKKSGSPEQLEKMAGYLKKIQALGGFDSIVPTEGIVFKWNGNLYKFVGAFAEINQLLGIIRYGR